MPSVEPLPVAERPAYPNIPTAISRRESDLLAELTANRQVLEIGSYLGYSTVWMALNGAYVTAVDPHDWLDSKIEFEDNLRRYGVAERVARYYCRSQDFIRSGPDGAYPVAFPHFAAVFIDGDHSEEQATFDIRLALTLADEWVICHDYTFPGYCGGGWPGVIAAVDRWLAPSAAEVRREGCIYAARLKAGTRSRQLVSVG